MDAGSGVLILFYMVDLWDEVLYQKSKLFSLSRTYAFCLHDLSCKIDTMDKNKKRYQMKERYFQIKSCGEKWIGLGGAFRFWNPGGICLTNNQLYFAYRREVHFILVTPNFFFNYHCCRRNIHNSRRMWYFVPPNFRGF